MEMTYSVLVVLICAVSVNGCGSPPDPLGNRDRESASEVATRSEPLGVRCSAERSGDGRIVVRYQARNLSRSTIYIPDERRMPYEVMRDGVLVVLQGVNVPDPKIMYEMYKVPRVTPLKPGEAFQGEVELGQLVLLDHYGGGPSPAEFMHGRIRVACSVGWGATPIPEPLRMPFDEFMKWQHVTNSEPFEVVLP